MSCKTTREKIDVMEAFERGETIQTYDKLTKRWVGWRPCAIEPVWCWGMHDYRVEPKPREWWIHKVKGVAHCVHSSPEFVALCEKVNRWGTPPDRVRVREVLEEE